MDSFAVIIPDRGDRPELTKHCFKQIERMTLKPDQVIHVDWKAISPDFDLVERVHYGVEAAKAFGIDLVFILENDDYYPADYFEKFGDMKSDFFGDDLTFYYNLRQRTFNSFYHKNRSSLFTTGFRISSLGNFQWAGDQFIDLRLWDWAKTKGLSTRFVNTGAIGMKHGVGLCGGKGHKMKLKNEDNKLTWLNKRVDPDSFEFYKTMSMELIKKEFA